MSHHICENCGHPQPLHHEEGCEYCLTDHEIDKTFEVCPGFKPDIYNTWELDEDEEGYARH